MAPDEIRFNIPTNDVRHFYYRNDGIANSLSLVVATTLDDASIADFDPDYPYAAHSWFRIDLNPAAASLDITDALLIDGYTQVGAAQNSLVIGDNAALRIELTSSGADNDNGITVQAGGAGSTIRGLVINGFDGLGILTEPDANGVTIRGNFIGTDITGTRDRGNSDAGIQLRSNNNLVGGPNTADRNVISGNESRGVVTFTFGSLETGNVVRNNYIGVDATGVRGLGNTGAGIQVWNQDGMQILDNVLAGNTTYGVWFRTGSSATNTIIQGNFIGVGADGATSIGNANAGILIESSSTFATIGGNLAGQGNTIAHNGGSGIAATSGTGAAIWGNAIFINSGLGIDLGNNGVTGNDGGDSDGGPNRRQNFPVLTSAITSGGSVTVVGSLSSTSSGGGRTYRIEFFASAAPDGSGFGEAERFLGSANVMTDGSGSAAINVTLTASVTEGEFVSATATDLTTSDTSEFAQNIIATGPNTSPIIVSNGGGAVAAINVAENAAAVTTVTAADADLPAQTLTYTINGGADAAKFAINSSNGALTFITAPNYETPADNGVNNVYDVTVQVSDGNGGSDSQSISVTVSDVNEFDASAISDTDAAANAVDENAANGTAVGITAFSSDADGTNNTITYSLDDNAGGRFAIDGATGIVTVANGTLLDREMAASHNITVRATSSDTSFSVQSFAINVLPVNDNDPVITSDGGGAIASVGVAENTAAVTTVVATDADLPGQTLTYTIIGGADAAEFAINSSSGALTFIIAPNYETPADSGVNNVYDVTVQVSDGNGGSDSQTISVTVNDVDEFDASAISDTDAAANAVNENAAIGATVGITAFSSDADGSNNAITYSLDDNAGGRFAIDGATGIVTVANGTLLDREMAASHNITVRATSSDTSFSVQGFAINVLPVNDNDPVITSDGGGAIASVSIVENTVAVTTVMATDADLPGQTLSYFISGGADAATFSIDNATGVLKFIAPPNFELPTDADANNVYEVEVMANDGNGGMDFQAIQVTVTPGNDYSPVFTSASTANVAENTVAVLTVHATDADTPAQTVTYSLSGGADVAKFSLDSATGELTFIAPADFESPTDADANNVYEVEITASDGSGRTTVQAIQITVTPVNDNNPVFTSPTTANVPENTTAVLTVNATDADSPTQTVTYSLSGGADAALFSIDNTTGALTFIAAPDFESPVNSDVDNVYELQVKADDGAGRSTTQGIQVTVTPVNEAPVVAGDSFTVEGATTLRIAAPGVLANDIDPEGTVLLVALQSGPAHGTLMLSSDGSFVYTPHTGFIGIDSFVYEASDGIQSVAAAVTITVTIPPAPPPPPPGPGPQPDPQPVPAPLPDPEPNEQVNFPTAQPPVPTNSQTSEATKSADPSINSSEIPTTDFTDQRIGSDSSETFDFAVRIRRREQTALGRTNVAGDPGEASPGSQTYQQVAEAYSQPFLSNLDQLRQEVEEDVQFEQVVLGSTALMASGLSVGYVIWMIRGGVLLSTLLSSMPAWQLVDPMPVLGYLNETGEEDMPDDSLEELIRKGQAEVAAEKSVSTS